MNVFDSVYDRNCPTCGCSLRSDLIGIAGSTEHGLREVTDFQCRCGEFLSVKFEWGVIWSEVAALEYRRPNKGLEPTAPAGSTSDDAPTGEAH